MPPIAFASSPFSIKRFFFTISPQEAHRHIEGVLRLSRGTRESGDVSWQRKKTKKNVNLLVNFYNVAPSTTTPTNTTCRFTPLRATGRKTLRFTDARRNVRDQDEYILNIPRIIAFQSYTFIITKSFIFIFISYLVIIMIIIIIISYYYNNINLTKKCNLFKI